MPQSEPRSRRPRVEFDTRKIVETMVARGWNGKDLARRCGLAPVTVSRFLRGRQASPRTAQRIAAELGQPLNTFIARPSSRKRAEDEPSLGR